MLLRLLCASLYKDHKPTVDNNVHHNHHIAGNRHMVWTIHNKITSTNVALSLSLSGSGIRRGNRGTILSCIPFRLSGRDLSHHRRGRIILGRRRTSQLIKSGPIFLSFKAGSQHVKEKPVARILRVPLQIPFHLLNCASVKPLHQPRYIVEYLLLLSIIQRSLKIYGCHPSHPLN